MDTSIKIGLVCGIHCNMPGDDEGEYKSAIEGMNTLAAELDFDLLTISTPLRSEEDALKARKQLDDSGVDITLIFNASLPYGRIILPLAGIKSHLAIWSVPEPENSGTLQLNSYCGLNMLGSILRNYFKNEDIKYKWLYGKCDTALFRERFIVMLNALRGVKALQTARIGQIGDLADGFENLYVDERRLKHKFGTYIQTRHSVEEIVRKAQSYSEAEIASGISQLSKEGMINAQRICDEDLNQFTRIDLALNEFQNEHNYDALAISCWSRFQEVCNVAVCGALSRLNNRGIVASCEADISSAVSMLMLNAMNGKQSGLNDLVSLDESDHSLALWHCGVSPACFANEKCVTWDSHFNIGSYCGGEWCGRGVVADMQYKSTEITIATIDNDFEKIMCITGDVLPEKKGYSGSGGWIGNLRVNGEEISIQDLINTISIAEVNHHYPTAFGKLNDSINEFAFWTDTKVINKQNYTPYMQSFI